MSSSVTEQASDQHCGNVEQWTGFPISFDPALGPNQCVLMIDGEVVSNFVVTSYQVTHDTLDTHIYVEGRSMPVLQNIDITFSVDLDSAPTDEAEKTMDIDLHTVATVQKEILDLEQQDLLKGYTPLAYISDECPPWIPTTGDIESLVMDEYRRGAEEDSGNYPLPRFYDPLAYFTGTMGPSTTYLAPSASQDMSKRPRPRYGWRG